MNERIKELAKEAKEYAINRLDETGELHKYYDVYFEKFAELIVEECATVIEGNLFQGIGWNTSRAVKRHFGIGEEE
jgi:hypothetical protein